MQASELRPGQWFEFVDDDEHGRCLYLGKDDYGYNFAFFDCPGTITYDCKSDDVEVNADVPQCWPGDESSSSQVLNIDAGTEQFELSRSLHRVVRAMHDGHCPKCGHLASSMEFEPSPGYHVCPECEFAITKEESDEALAMFLPYMQKNYDKFVAWQLHGRFASKRQQPREIQAGDWLYCINDNSCYFGYVLECRGYSPERKAVAVMLPDGELSAMARNEVRLATPAEIEQHTRTNGEG